MEKTKPNQTNQTNQNNRHNGRIDIIAKTQPPDIKQLFSLYDRIPANQCSTYREPTVGQWEDTLLSKAYFSKENMQIIQNGIRAGVYKKSNNQYLVGQQDCDSLKIIMRSIFLQNAVNQPHDIPQQIEQLNKLVIQYGVHHVYSEAKGYMNYLRDVSTLAVPLSNPIVERQKDKNNYLMPEWF